MIIDNVPRLSQELKDRVVKYRKWFGICEQLHAAVINFYALDSDSIENAPEERVIEDNVNLHEATAIGSRTYDWRRRPCDWHQPMFDIDIPHVYVSSSTEGHGHLIFRKRMPWADYLKVLKVMSDVGLIQPGYYHAAEARGEAWLRVPWVAKGELGNVPEQFSDDAGDKNERK